MPPPPETGRAAKGLILRRVTGAYDRGKRTAAQPRSIAGSDELQGLPPPVRNDRKDTSCHRHIGSYLADRRFGPGSDGRIASSAGVCGSSPMIDRSLLLSSRIFVAAGYLDDRSSLFVE